MRSFAISTVLLSVLLPSCTTADVDPLGGEWRGTFTTEGNVTTVVNESGSVWGGTAKLVEEASIGVDRGEDPYMFGEVSGVFVSDTHIYVVDRQTPRVRMYSLAGEYVRDIGREGQGPGEYTRPGIVRGDEAGRLFVQDHGGHRFNVYSVDGDLLDTWSADFVCCAFPMVMAPDGLLWFPVFHGPPRSGVPELAAQGYGPDGLVDPLRLPREPEFKRAEIKVELRGPGRIDWPVPFTPRFTWNIAYSGAIVAGASDRYRFEIQSADGSTLIVEHYGEPAPIIAAEAEWYRRQYVASLRRITTSPGWNWDGAEMPGTKPAFFEIIPTLSGDIWVARQGPGERMTECTEDPMESGEEAIDQPCWRDTWIIDAFGGDGRYLGEIERIRNFWPLAANTFVRGDVVVAAVEDEAATIMVKRYRLVLPGEE